MSLRDRIGIDLGRKARLEDGIEWAGKQRAAVSIIVSSYTTHTKKEES